MGYASETVSELRLYSVPVFLLYYMMCLDSNDMYAQYIRAMQFNGVDIIIIELIMFCLW